MFDLNKLDVFESISEKDYIFFRRLGFLTFDLPLEKNYGAQKIKNMKQ